MQRVTNCILLNEGHILLLKKPSRGWYAIPGGKMEQGETIKESVTREFREETALELEDPKLMGAFTFNVYSNKELLQEWMMFTFICDTFKGELAEVCREGELVWVPQDQVHTLPMAEGDRSIYKHALHSKGMLYGSFDYTDQYSLIEMRLDPSGY
ncbi:NUDIX hydrolase [Lentibacillus sp. JNUCC-1]|uniref:NUDIX hydrolase n=1 Tax=Lentibacillus sp. JNUCC-1 TaxID=2654513 RepID=UPI0012E824D6|nr:8-oxo-dGTP diphosphatase [Lentibacillus sp. JNUCC-1]